MINERLIGAVHEIQDALSSVSMRAQLDLPQICVVGSQSAGKSSVLESLVGKDFLPRGSGIVTRCPLVLRLSPGPAGSEEYGEFSHKPDKKYTNFNEICSEIERRTEEVGGKTGISPNPILLTITSPHVLAMTLIDLPGLVSTHVGAQSQDIDRQIHDMVITFIKPPNTIILAVTPANSDLANSGAIRAARSVDPELNRTIGVLTKIDIMDEGTNALDILEGRTLPLKRGWIGVVNRSQKAINERRTMAEARAAERKYFEEHPEYSRIANRCGTEFLAKTMSTVLLGHIQKCLPDLRRKVEDMILDTTKRMEQYGMLDPANKEPSSILLGLLNNYTALVRDSIEGRRPPPGAENEPLYGGALLDDMIQRRFTEHVLSMRAAPRLSDELLREKTLNSAGIEGSLITSERGFRTLAKIMVHTLEDPMLKLIDIIHDELKRLCTMCCSVLAQYPQLQNRVQEAVCQLITDYRGPTTAHVKTMMASETSYINVKHPKVQEMVYKSEFGGANVPPPQPNMINQPQHGGQQQPQQYVNPQPQGPMTAAERQQAEFKKLRDLVELYFTVVKSTVCDQMPKIIHYLLIQKLEFEMDKHLMKTFFKPELFNDLLSESPQIARRKEGLAKMMEALNKTKAALDRVRDMPDQGQ